MQIMKNPGIDIKYGHFLDPFMLAFAASDPQNEGRALLTKEEVLEKIENYKKEWSKNENIILEGMQEILELRFSHNIIDVYVVTVSRGSFSDPVVIPSKFSPEQFVDILTHELIHRLMSANANNILIGKILMNTFPDESKLTRIHILLHAVHKHIYLNVLQSESRLNANIERHEKFPAYKKSWEIVEKYGYQELIEKIKQSY